MELERIEFTTEDILAIHRGWIEQLYLQNRNTEAEIVELLSQQRLIVTLSQVQQCIREWNLQPRPFSSIPGLDDFLSLRPSLISIAPSRNDVTSLLRPSRTYQPIPSASHRSSPQPISHNAQETEAYYAQRQLPPIPSPTDDPTLRRDRRTRTPPLRTGSRCTHGHEPHECREARYLLDTLPQGPSSIRIYSDTEEIHERFSIGLAGSRYRPERLASASPELVEPRGAPVPKTEATAVKRDQVTFTPRDDNGVNLEVDGNCDSSSDEVIELKYVRAKDMALKGSRMDRMQSVRIRYGDKKDPKRDAKKAPFAADDDDEDEIEVQHVEEDRKRKRRDSPPSPKVKESHKNDREKR